MKSKIIAQGAEAILIKEKNYLLKKRINKGYRIKEIDEKLRKFRTRKETKLLQKVSKMIPTAKVIDSSDKDMEIKMQFLEGEKLSDVLDKLPNAKEVCKKIGEQIAKLHDSEIIHGDLTTSNMIIKSDKVYFIDFGLGFESKNAEDKAVDLHLIKQALEAKHFDNFQRFFKEILEGYSISKNAKETLKRLEKVEKRGRYKNAF